MKTCSRRDLLKLGVLAPAAAHAVASEALGLSGAAFSAPRQDNAAKGGSDSSPRERIIFDSGWRFHFGHASDPSRDFGFGGGDGGAFAKSGELFAPARNDFNDGVWQAINLPHDFVVALPFVNDPDLYQFGYKPVGRKYPETSIGWYRRVFEIPRSDVGRRMSIEFDGVFRNAMVVLNGIYLGRNLSGYAPFRFDVTDLLHYGDANVLVVRVDATEHEGWFYEGGGIYRHVWLTKTSPVHIAHEGVYVAAQVNGDSAQISIVTEISNEADTAKSFGIAHTIFDSAGKHIADVASHAAPVSAWATEKISQTLHVNNPLLWAIEDPKLYRLVTTIENAGSIADRVETSFGIRTIRFDPDHGFFLNGQRVEIKGMCDHQDHAGVGSALPDRLQYFRIARLKEMGVNAYRTSHNPPTPALLEACDRLGMLVMDETRMFSSSAEGLSQLERMVRRDRNHPCIFLWSLGNEEPLQGKPAGARIADSMKRLVRCLDETRPVTLAMNGSWGKGASAMVDVQGCNYFHLGDMDKFHAAFPQKPIIGSEDASTLSTRGIYANEAARGYMSAYDVNRPYWGSLAEDWWNYYAARPFAAGAFVWTGFDYRGEPTPYKWPCISSHFGVMDTCGFPKDTYFYYQAQWSNKTVLHLFPHWNWPGKEGQPIAVWAYSNCDEVELLLNEASLGRKSMAPRGHLEWQVKYAPGKLLARGYKNGKAIVEDSRETTGGPALIKLIPDRASIDADAQDVSVITASILDSQNRIVPIANNEITFEVDGPGKIIGVGNGDPSSHEADKPPSELYDSHGALIFAALNGGGPAAAVNSVQPLTTRSVFNGLAQLIVQSRTQAGEIRVSAHADGLAPASIMIHAGLRV